MSTGLPLHDDPGIKAAVLNDDHNAIMDLGITAVSDEVVHVGADRTETHGLR
jgi:hypothetical protein